MGDVPSASVWATRLDDLSASSTAGHMRTTGPSSTEDPVAEAAPACGPGSPAAGTEAAGAWDAAVGASCPSGGAVGAAGPGGAGGRAAGSTTVLGATLDS